MNGNFYELDELDSSVEPIIQAFAGTKALIYNGKHQGTAVMVSSDGKFLMTSHQLEHCFAEKGLYDGDGYIHQVPEGLACRFMSTDGITRSFKVKFAQPCKAMVAINLSQDILAGRLQADQLTGKQRLCLESKDIALVENMSSQNWAVSCLSHSRTELFAPGTRVATIGAANATSRRGLKNTEGKYMTALFGEIVNRDDCFNHYGPDERDYMVAADVGSDIKPQKKLLRGYVQTDLLINQGSSGGPALNQNGEVIGIIAASLVSPKYSASTSPCVGGTFIVPLSELKKTAASWGVKDFDPNSLKCHD